MATEQEKLVNRERMWSMVAIAVTRGVWDLIKDTAATLSPEIGTQILAMVEKQMNLQATGDTPEAVITSVGKMCVEGLGFAESASVEAGEKTIKLTLTGAEATSEFDQMKASGVNRLFSHPFLCCGLAALARIGRKCRGDLQVDASAKTTVITFELL
jgi:hypothetical protein